MTSNTYADVQSFQNWVSHHRTYTFASAETCGIWVYNNNICLSNKTHFNTDISIAAQNITISLCPLSCSHLNDSCVTDNVWQWQPGYGGHFWEGCECWHLCIFSVYHGPHLIVQCMFVDARIIWIWDSWFCLSGCLVSNALWSAKLNNTVSDLLLLGDLVYISMLTLDCSSALKDWKVKQMWEHIWKQNI